MNLFDKKVLICLGPGGVGKTTTSVSLALQAANLGKKCLVMTIDPSRRLATVLDIDKKSNKEKLIQKYKNKGELWGKIIEPEKAFKAFVLSFSEDKERAKKLFDNVLFKQLTSTLKDSQDFTSIETLVKACENTNYDLIILDTPPIQNLTDFFDAPENMYNLFNSTFFKIIGDGSDSQSLIKKFIGKGAQGVLSLLSKVTGKLFVEELIIFFKTIESLSIEIKSHSKKVDEILGSSDTGYVLITEAEQSRLIEAKEISDQLKLKKFKLETTILNRCYPLWFYKKNNKIKTESDENLQIFNNENKFYKEKRKIIDTFCQSNILPGNIIKMPILEGIDSLDDIKAMTEFIGEI